MHQVTSALDLFPTRLKNKLPHFVLPVPDPLAWAVDALGLSFEDLTPYAFPPVAILGKVVAKLQDYPCRRIILIAPGWPNMPRFLVSGHVNPEPYYVCLRNLPNLLVAFKLNSSYES